MSNRIKTIPYAALQMLEISGEKHPHIDVHFVLRKMYKCDVQERKRLCPRTTTAAIQLLKEQESERSQAPLFVLKIGCKGLRIWTAVTLN